VGYSIRDYRILGVIINLSLANDASIRNQDGFWRRSSVLLFLCEKVAARDAVYIDPHSPIANEPIFPFQRPNMKLPPPLTYE
jgi:hypothetical protein